MQKKNTLYGNTVNSLVDPTMIDQEGDLAIQIYL